ncbi:superoxide dismutase family protein [Streptosporangium sp. NBC_01755]|uniref:superoxide dismutase family protein n=1 Tax=unclassified Streptosporangium TaxID=2632669 RepID=UPI002DD810BB|nr:MULTISPECIES: superoxide dismutase family protein [unclassified Streptosporangium]WSA26586.1 superoxide dismutase family protein [Streptosporangium sp. NBC_01810]WSD01990.1 superoxide dismutase family protein [Streptosporangium sp. NBC_01755]
MFHRTCLALAVALGTLAAGTGATAQATSHVPRWPWPSAEAVIKNTAGKNVGFLRIDHKPYNKSRLTVSVSGLNAGYHGFHIHTRGVCDPKAIDPVTRSPFSSAGAHFTIHSATHGDHSGDLPNLLVAADGTGEATVVTDRFRVGQLFDSDGSSIVVHMLPDNHANIPDRYGHPADPGDPAGTGGPDAETLKAGDSGGRVACGVIIRH